MIFPDYYQLELLFFEHRNKSFITCEETCFCWDVEQWLVSSEIPNEVKENELFS